QEHRDGDRQAGGWLIAAMTHYGSFRVNSRREGAPFSPSRFGLSLTQSGTRGPGASRCGNCFSAGVQHLIVWHPRRSGGHVRRREFITLLSGAAVGWPVAANAQQAAKIARIGWLGVHLAPNPQAREAFRQGLRELGYVEGRNLVIEYRDAEGKF